jgi:FMN-dependent NADH-azoreductase
MFQGSISRQLTEEFVHKWQAAHPNQQVITRDLNQTELHPIDAAWVGAAFTPETARTAEQIQLLTLSDTLISELEAADEYVFGVPMHNFSVPSTMKLWIDLIARVGKTFSYADGRPKGLLTGKKATFLISSGGVYDAGSALASFNFVEPYLRAAFGFLRVTNSFITVGGTSALQSKGLDRASFLQPHLEAIALHVNHA